MDVSTLNASQFKNGEVNVKVHPSEYVSEEEMERL